MVTYGMSLFAGPSPLGLFGCAAVASGVALRRRVARAAVLTLGTRGSPLALAQAYEAKRRLGEATMKHIKSKALYVELKEEDNKIIR